MLEFGVCIWIYFIEWHHYPGLFCEKMLKIVLALPVVPWACQGSCKSAPLATPIPTLPPPRKEFKTIKLLPHDYLQVKHFLLKQMGNCQCNGGDCSPVSHPWSMLLILLMPANHSKFKQCPVQQAEAESLRQSVSPLSHPFPLYGKIVLFSYN